MTPENPVEWTLSTAHDPRLPLYAAAVGPASWAREQAPTRFKAWWRVIAQAIELASEGAVSFADAMANSEADDDEELAVADLLRVLSTTTFRRDVIPPPRRWRRCSR